MPTLAIFPMDSPWYVLNLALLFLQIGRIYYNASNPYGCWRSNFTDDYSGDPDGILTPIFLVDRGECTFATKVRNVEKAGGSLAVIIDNTDENIRNVIMSDDGTGSGIRIPSMLISKKDGEILKKFLTQQPEDITEKAALTAEFVMENPDNTVEWELFYTSDNDKSLDFISNFAEYYEKFSKTDVDFTPQVVTWACPNCDGEFKKKECVSDGKYCSMNHQSSYVRGYDVIMEDLREICLWNRLKKEGKEILWWKYIKHVHSLCYEEITAECSRSGHKQISQNYEDTMTCVRESFDGSNFQKDDNLILKQGVTEFKKYGHNYWPSAVINERTFRGDLVPDNVF